MFKILISYRKRIRFLKITRQYSLLDINPQNVSAMLALSFILLEFKFHVLEEEGHGGGVDK